MASFFRPNGARLLSTLAAASSALAASSAVAHPGHGVTPDGDSAAHYLLEPLHGLSLVLGLLVVIVCVRLVWLRQKARITHD